MSATDYLFTSESVSEGHPDKVSDRISDEVVDLYLAADPEARVACETLVTTNRIVLAGEVRGPDAITHDRIEATARDAVRDIGYAQDGFHWRDAVFENHLHEQSADIAMGVDAGADKDEGAGDQGIMFGYASDETDALMPAPIYYSHRILKKLAALRHAGDTRLEPDSKSQVTLEYRDNRPVRASSVVVSTQHHADVSQDDLRDLVTAVIADALPDGWMPDEKDIYVNPTGQFIIGGPDGDAGLTGRKIIVDTYGGAAPHGGGAFSGKDPTKVDRSAAYVARYMAKNIVGAGLSPWCTLQLSYAIGVSKPLSLYVDMGENPQVDPSRLADVLRDLVDLSPRGIRTHLGLNKPIYARTAAYGHFGRTPTDDGGFSWERLDLVDALKSEFGQ